MDETKYIQGFNSGYILAEYKQELAKIISKNPIANNDYLEGLTDGKEQLEFEKTIEKLSELDTLRNKEPDREKELDL